MRWCAEYIHIHVLYWVWNSVARNIYVIKETLAGLIYLTYIHIYIYIYIYMYIPPLWPGRVWRWCWPAGDGRPRRWTDWTETAGQSSLKHTSKHVWANKYAQYIHVYIDSITQKVEVRYKELLVGLWYIYVYVHVHFYEVHSWFPHCLITTDSHPSFPQSLTNNYLYIYIYPIPKMIQSRHLQGTVTSIYYMYLRFAHSTLEEYDT